MFRTDIARTAATALCTLVASFTVLTAAVVPAQVTTASGSHAVVAAARLTA